MEDQRTKILNDGQHIPVVGLGTWKVTDEKAVKDSIRWALDAGYRHIDTAMIYKNEEAVGQAIKETSIPREEIFITTKLWNDDHHDVAGALATSLEKLGLDYVDLYLMHWPVPESRTKSWAEMVELQKKGKTMSIGVSNFLVRHLSELLKTTDVVPSVNQVEFTPFLYQKDLLDYCNENKIVLEAYSPLTQGKDLGNEVILSIAKDKDKSAAQVMLRWLLQHGLVVLPKSTNQGRIEENFDIFDFELSDSQMEQLNELNDDRRYCWDPNGLE